MYLRGRGAPRSFALAFPVLRAGGPFVFTVEALEGNKDAAAGAENDPKGYALPRMEVMGGPWARDGGCRNLY